MWAQRQARGAGGDSGSARQTELEVTERELERTDLREADRAR
jgi:hypothetical protein